MPLTNEAIAALATLAAEDAGALLHTVTGWSNSKTIATARHELEISYQGQGHSLAISFVPETENESALAARFDALHARVRGHAFESRRRIVALRSIATSAVDESGARQPGARHAAAASDPMQHRLVATDPPSRCPVFAGQSLAAGTQLTGPALIDAPDTTIWLPPGWTCDVAPDDTLILTAMRES
jgi:N-methylhydantoinase A